MVLNAVITNNHQSTVNFTRGKAGSLTQQNSSKHLDGANESRSIVENNPPKKPSNASVVRQEHISQEQQIPLATKKAVVSAPVINAQNNHVNPTHKQLDAYQTAQSYKEPQQETLVDGMLEDLPVIKESYEQDAQIRDAEFFEYEPEVNVTSDAAYVADNVSAVASKAYEEHSESKVKQAAKTPSSQNKAASETSSPVEVQKEQVANEIQKKTDEIISGEGEGTAARTAQTFSVESPLAMFTHAANAYSQFQDNKAATSNPNQFARTKSLESLNISI